MALRLPIRYEHIMHHGRAFGRWKQTAQLSSPLSTYHHVMSTSLNFSNVLPTTPVANHTAMLWTSLRARGSLLVHREQYEMVRRTNQLCKYTTNASQPSSQNQPQPNKLESNTEKPKSSTERIKVILKEYGAVAFVFHISVSLCSVGTCYILVSK